MYCQHLIDHNWNSSKILDKCQTNVELLFVFAPLHSWVSCQKVTLCFWYKCFYNEWVTCILSEHDKLCYHSLVFYNQFSFSYYFYLLSSLCTQSVIELAPQGWLLKFERICFIFHSDKLWWNGMHFVFPVNVFWQQNCVIFGKVQ